MCGSYNSYISILLDSFVNKYGGSDLSKPSASGSWFHGVDIISSPPTIVLHSGARKTPNVARGQTLGGVSSPSSTGTAIVGGLLLGAAGLFVYSKVTHQSIPQMLRKLKFWKKGR